MIAHQSGVIPSPQVSVPPISYNNEAAFQYLTRHIISVRFYLPCLLIRLDGSVIIFSNRRVQSALSVLFQSYRPGCQLVVNPPLPQSKMDMRSRRGIYDIIYRIKALLRVSMSTRRDEKGQERSTRRLVMVYERNGRGSRRTCKQNTQIPQFGGTFTWERMQPSRVE